MATTPINTYTGKKLEPFINPEQARMINVRLQASVTLARGTVLGELTATQGTFKAYASGNADGSQNPKAILVFDVTTNASGEWAYGEFGETRPGVPVYYAGTFKTEDLTGLDATALTNAPQWRLAEGTVASGILRLG